MRFILWLGLVLGVLWGGYWFVGSSAIKGGATQWFDGVAAQGLFAENSGIEVSGFPSRFDLTVGQPRLSDPQSGWGWRAPFAQILSMTWKPWHVIAMLPHDQEIDGPGQRIALTTSKMAASFRVLPSTDLTFDGLVLEGHEVTAQSDLGWQVGAASVVLALSRDADTPFAQHLGLEVTGLRPDPALAGMLPDLGEVIETVHLDATVTLTAALDRHVAETSPVVTDLILKDFTVKWGKLNLAASGRLEPGPDGRALGKIDVRIEGWDQIPALVVALGLVRPEMGKSLTDGLDALAKAGEDPNVLSLPLTFSDGWMTLGPLPLGPAPLLTWMGQAET